MKNVDSVTIAASRLSKRMATNDDAAANEEEVEGQIEEKTWRRQHAKIKLASRPRS